jgi:L-glutamine-phosphate cytidylyltransferase
MEAVILAAGMGRRLNHHTTHIPKGLLHVAGLTLVERQIEQLRSAGVDRITIVVGHGADEVRRTVRAYPRLTFRFNPEYATANVIVSLALGIENVSEDLILLLSDFVYDDAAFDPFLMPREEKVLLGIDGTFNCGTEDMKVWHDGPVVVGVSKNDVAPGPRAKFTGISFFRRNAVEIVKKEVDRFLAAGERDSFYGDVIDSLIRRRLASVGTVAMAGIPWAEINYENDLEVARSRFPTDGKGVARRSPGSERRLPPKKMQEAPAWTAAW